MPPRRKSGAAKKKKTKQQANQTQEAVAAAEVEDVKTAEGQEDQPEEHPTPEETKEDASVEAGDMQKSSDSVVEQTDASAAADAEAADSAPSNAVEADVDVTTEEPAVEEGGFEQNSTEEIAVNSAEQAPAEQEPTGQDAVVEEHPAEEAAVAEPEPETERVVAETTTEEPHAEEVRVSKCEPAVEKPVLHEESVQEESPAPAPAPAVEASVAEGTSANPKDDTDSVPTESSVTTPNLAAVDLDSKASPSSEDESDKQVFFHKRAWSNRFGSKFYTATIEGYELEAEDCLLPVPYYLVNVRCGNDSWVVRHRYSDFDGLMKEMKDAFPQLEEFFEKSMPPKTPLGIRFVNADFINARATALNEFMEESLKQEGVGELAQVREFLQLDAKEH